MPAPRRPHESSHKSNTKAGSRGEGAVRIIGGTLRGRVIPYNGDPRTRPMKDRVREAIFNLIGRDVQGKHAFDLFAGTGVVGFEAISRGAARATLVERHFPTARSLNEHAQLLGIGELVEVAAGDSFVWVKRLSPPTTSEPAWLVFCCPPYSFYVERQGEQLGMIARMMELAPVNSVFVVESDERFSTNLLPDAEHWQVRAYLPAVVAIYRKTAAESEIAS